MTFSDKGKPPTKSIETLSHGREVTGSGVYSPSFLLLGLLTAHNQKPLTKCDTLSRIQGQ